MPEHFYTTVLTAPEMISISIARLKLSYPEPIAYTAYPEMISISIARLKPKLNTWSVWLPPNLK